jgi:uncharacterized protein
MTPLSWPPPSWCGREPAIGSALYEGTVCHRRLTPAARSFTPRLFFAYLDVDALPGLLDRLVLWSGRHPAPLWFRPRDYLDGTDRPLGPRVRDLVEAHLGRRPQGAIDLLSQVRTFGWLFNPLTVYYCWDRDRRRLDALVLEVTNTPWGQRHCYVIEAREGTRTATTPKVLHVSPFLPADLDYQVTWTIPAEQLDLRIDASRRKDLLFTAHLRLRRRPLNGRTALTLPARYPMQPLRVSARIYAEALRLTASGVGRHPHTERSGPGANSCAR